MRTLRLIRTTLRRLTRDELARAHGGTRLVLAPPPPPPSDSCVACAIVLEGPPARDTHTCAPLTTTQAETRVGC